MLDMPITVVRQTAEYVVVNKPPSIPVHPCGRFRKNTLLHILEVNRLPLLMPCSRVAFLCFPEQPPCIRTCFTPSYAFSCTIAVCMNENVAEHHLPSSTANSFRLLRVGVRI